MVEDGREMPFLKNVARSSNGQAFRSPRAIQARRFSENMRGEHSGQEAKYVVGCVLVVVLGGRRDGFEVQQSGFEVQQSGFAQSSSTRTTKRPSSHC